MSMSMASISRGSSKATTKKLAHGVSHLGDDDAYEMQLPTNKSFSGGSRDVVAKEFEEVAETCLKFSKRLDSLSSKVPDNDRASGTVLAALVGIRDALSDATRHLESRGVESAFVHESTSTDKATQDYIMQLLMLLLTTAWKCSSCAWACSVEITRHSLGTMGWMFEQSGSSANINWSSECHTTALFICDHMTERMRRFRMQFQALDRSGSFVEVQSQLVRLNEFLTILRQQAPLNNARGGAAVGMSPQERGRMDSGTLSDM